MCDPTVRPLRRPSVGAAAGAARGRARRALAIGLAASVLGLAACAARPPLLDERRVEPYAGLVARFDAAARRDERVLVTPDGGPTVAVGVHELRAPVGAAGGAERPVLVMLPGILSDGTTWRFLAGALVDTFDVVLVDPPGVGTSDRPMPPAGGDALYTPTWLAACTGLALRAWQARQPAPRRLVLVGHSLGGTVVLRLLASSALGARLDDVRSSVQGAVLLAPADLALREASPLLAEIRDTPAWKARLGCALGVVGRKTETAVHDGVVCPRDRALAQEACRLSATLCDPCTLAAAQWMLRRFQPTDACGRPDLAAADRLADEERSIRVPLLVLWGAQDDTLPLATSAPLMARLPTATRVVVDGAKHSLHQELAPRVAAEVRAFVGASSTRSRASGGDAP